MAQHTSRVDWWLAALMTLPAIGGIAVLGSGIATGHRDLLYTGAATIAGYGLLLALLVIPITYVIDTDGVRIRAGALLRISIPWDRLISAELSANPMSGPGLSLKRLNLEYRRPSGRETFVLISPTDRDAFLRELASTSPRHHLVDGKLVAT
jgi:hypothetical protein